MKSKVEKYAAALKSLFYPTWDKIDVHIESSDLAREAYDLILRYLPPHKLNVYHLYYIGYEHVENEYYYTEYQDKEEWVENEPGYMEEFGNYPKYKKIHTRVPVKKCINNGGYYEKNTYQVKRIELAGRGSFYFYLHGDRCCKKSLIDNFTPFFIKTKDKGKTFFSSEKID